jgi:hypothetical protein
LIETQVSIWISTQNQPGESSRRAMCAGPRRRSFSEANILAKEPRECPPLTVLVAIGIVVYVIGQQLVGGGLSGKRVVVLPAVLTVIGIVEISGHNSHPGATDIVLLVVSAAIAIATGAGLGAMTRLERRDGYLWAQLPKQGLWLWSGLIASRLVITGIAHAAGPHAAAGTTAIRWCSVSTIPLRRWWSFPGPSGPVSRSLPRRTAPCSAPAGSLTRPDARVEQRRPAG